MGVASEPPTAAAAAATVLVVVSSPAAETDYSQRDSTISQSLVALVRMQTGGVEEVGGAEGRGLLEGGGAPGVLRGVVSAGSPAPLLSSRRGSVSLSTFLRRPSPTLCQSHSHTGIQEPDHGGQNVDWNGDWSLDWNGDWSVDWNVDWNGDWSVDWNGDWNGDWSGDWSGDLNADSGVRTPLTPPQGRETLQNRDLWCWNGKPDASWSEWNWDSRDLKNQ